MKIGILTFHKSINNGAVMQCFSLSKRIQIDYENVEVEVIDYHMPKIIQSYDNSLRQYFKNGNIIVKFKKLIKLILNPRKLQRLNKRNIVFENAFMKLPLSKHTILSDNSDLLINYINKNYDVVIVGSDAIWNYVTRGFPNPYFLNNYVSASKLTYAASCYGMPFENIPNEQKKIIGEILSSYEFLGVRDDESANFAKFVGVQGPQIIHTCDPTVFLDVDDLPINEEELKVKLIKRKFDFKKPSICVMGSEDMCSMVRKMYGKQYQIVGLYNYYKNVDVNLYDLSPFEWAYVFRFFKLTFTTYFHGTMLSLRNGIPVICIALNTEYSKTHKTKVADFLERVELLDWYFDTDYKTKNIELIKKKADEILSTETKDLIISKMSEEAKSYYAFKIKLDEVIREKQKNEN